MDRVAIDTWPIAYRRSDGLARLNAAIVAGLQWVSGTAVFAGVLYAIVALPGLVE